MTDENNDQADDLPQELIDELRSADRRVAMITSRVDREISAMARAQFARRSRPRRVAMFAAAASVLVAVLFSQTLGPDLDFATDGFADHDASGQIDIADVLYLARQSTDQAEIDKFALRVVALQSAGDTS